MGSTNADVSLHWEGAAVAAATDWPCLAFVNSVEWRLSDRNEFLTDYGDLVRWGWHAGLLTDEEARALLAAAAGRSREAADTHAQALVLREALYAVFSAVARKAAPPADALGMLNAALAEAMVPARLVPFGEGFRREWLDPKHTLEWLLHPVARSAAKLLISPELTRLKECPGSPGKACGFLFVDETKNRSRRWCSGFTCGNRARLHRHYARILSSTAGDTASDVPSDGEHHRSNSAD